MLDKQSYTSSLPNTLEDLGAIKESIEHRLYNFPKYPQPMPGCSIKLQVELFDLPPIIYVDEYFVEEYAKLKIVRSKIKCLKGSTITLPWTPSATVQNVTNVVNSKVSISILRDIGIMCKCSNGSSHVDFDSLKGYYSSEYSKGMMSTEFDRTYKIFLMLVRNYLQFVNKKSLSFSRTVLYFLQARDYYISSTCLLTGIGVATVHDIDSSHYRRCKDDFIHKYISYISS